MSVVKFKPKSKPNRLECSSCGAEGTGSCECGVSYIPAIDRAMLAVFDSPEKSDRAIAQEIGVDHKTVGKARRSTGDDSPVDERIGLDGKKRRLPRQNIIPDDEMPSEEEADESWQRDVYDQACLLLERMADATRQKFFAHIKRKYHDKN